MQQITWVDVATLITLVITACVFAIGLRFAYKQIKTAAFAAQATNFFSLVSYLQTKEVRDARQIVHNLGQNYEDWKKDDKNTVAAQAVASSFDIAAVAMKAGLIDAAVFSTPWKTAICSPYEILKEYIKDRQQNPKPGDRMYLAHYAGLAHFLRGRPGTNDEPFGVQF